VTRQEPPPTHDAGQGDVDTGDNGSGGLVGVPDERDDRISSVFEVAAVVLLALAAFTWRLVQDVGYWDTAIFQASPPVLGLTHPTGFPTFNILGWLWTSILPLGSAAFELNLMTAVSGALAVGLAYLVAVQVGADRLPAAAAALSCGLMVAFWRTSGHADPHPLHVLFALAVLSLLLRWDRVRRPRYLVAAALVFGLGMGNHMLMVMLAPGVGIFVLTVRPSLLADPRTVAKAAMGLLAGLAVYLYVPIRGAANPAIHYDYAPTTLPLFLRYVLGQDFSGQMAFLSIAGLGLAAGALGTFARQLGDSLTPPVAIGMAALAAIGLVALLAGRRLRVAWLLVSTGGLTLYARLTYQNGDIERYQLFPVAVLAILAALGATALWRLVVRALEPRDEDPAASAVARRRGALSTFLALAPAIVLIVPAFLFGANNGRVKVPDARCYVNALVADAPQDAAIVSWWSMVTPIWYAQAVERQRPDITAVSAGSTVVAEIARFQALGRPVLIIQLDGELKLARNAGYPMEEVRFCGAAAWRITGPPGVTGQIHP
jgi:hypothetical protein